MSFADRSPSLIGSSPAIVALRDELEYACRCDAKVLITGESGVGKEVVAGLIHSGSGRRNNPLITVNCAALTETLLETELFGHVRGSFTGAFRDRAGVLEQANRGTIFMDEVGETTPRMQGLLLRFLETGEIQRVGSDRPDARVNVRVIAATNRNLVEAVAAKSFRDDLYYRLNVIQLHVPPLRDREGDLPLLLAHFLTQFASQYQVPVPVLSAEANAILQSYPWPGNVRELKNVAERLVVRAGASRTIEVSDLPMNVREQAQPARRPNAAPSTAERLYQELVGDRESFWSVVYAPFMSRDMTRDDLRALVRKGLEHTNGSYRLLTELFNMPVSDYKRFLGFLKKHHCHVAFQPFRTVASGPLAPPPDREKRDLVESASWKKPA